MTVRTFFVWCVIAHIVVIAASNYLVQLPVRVWVWDATWGTFTFPIIFLLTDLAVRLTGNVLARNIVWLALLPALLCSYLLSTLYVGGAWQSWSALLSLNVIAARIALASMLAYLVGQLLDIAVFQRLRTLPWWWLAPAASTTIGSLADTFTFFAVAFYHSSDAFMRTHWPAIAWFDYAFKLVVSLVVFLPLYRLLLWWLIKHIKPSAYTVRDTATHRSPLRHQR